MDIDKLIKVLEDNKKQLYDILNNCKDGPAELALLASKMRPLLDNIASLEAQLNASASESGDPPDDQTENTTSGPQ